MLVLQLTLCVFLWDDFSESILISFCFQIFFRKHQKRLAGKLSKINMFVLHLIGIHPVCLRYMFHTTRLLFLWTHNNRPSQWRTSYILVWSSLLIFFVDLWTMSPSLWIPWKSSLKDQTLPLITVNPRNWFLAASLPKTWVFDKAFTFYKYIAVFSEMSMES